MIISAIKQSSPGRLTVIFDSGEEIKSTLAVVTDLRLFSGRELDEAQTEELRLASLRALAREKAIELLSRRSFSRKELKNKLISKGEDEDIAQYCVDWLDENRLLDDEAYAAAVARHYTAKGYGEGRVRAELSRRGISRELWDDVVAAMPETDGKLDKLIASRLKDPNDADELRKLTASLYRRGYSWEDIRAALVRYNADPEETL